MHNNYVHIAVLSIVYACTTAVYLHKPFATVSSIFKLS